LATIQKLLLLILREVELNRKMGIKIARRSSTARITDLS